MMETFSDFVGPYSNERKGCLLGSEIVGSTYGVVALKDPDVAESLLVVDAVWGRKSARRALLSWSRATLYNTSHMHRAPNNNATLAMNVAEDGDAGIVCIISYDHAMGTRFRTSDFNNPP